MSWRLKACPEDFVVEEVPLFEPSGEGGHTYVQVEKRLRTTRERQDSRVVYHYPRTQRRYGYLIAQSLFN